MPDFAITILQSEFFTRLVLPFLLVFALIFAILDKSKILGEGKRQINAIIAFVVALIFISFSSAVGITIQLMGFMAVVAVILLVFLLLYSFVGGKQEENWMKITFGIIIGIALIIALFVFTGFWPVIVNAVSSGSNIVANVIFIAVIIASIAIVLATGKKSGSS